MPPPTLRSESGLFVDDDGGWEPMRDEDEEEEDNARLEWDHSANPVRFRTPRAPIGCDVPVLTQIVQNPPSLHMSRVEERQGSTAQQAGNDDLDTQSTYLEPTQKLADVKNLALFPD
jgi:hypothetical protein